MPGDGVGVQVEEDAQHDHLALPGGQPPERGQHGGVQAGPGAPGCRGVVIGQRQLTCAAAPPRRPGIERGAHHPRPRRRMAADLPPGRPGPGDRLGDLILGEPHVAGAGGNRPQARIPARLEELGEPRLVMAHNR